MLSSDDIALLQILQAAPLKSYSALSETLGKAAQTVKKRYIELQSRFPDSFSVHGDLFYKRINLEMVDVFIYLRSISYIEIIQTALAFHEYIRFTARCIGLGSNSGIFAQFTMPNNSIPLLNEFLDIFVEHGYVDHYEIRIESEKNFIKLPELDAWIPDEHRWGISSKKITNKFAELSECSKTVDIPEIIPFDMNSFDKVKLIILEELTLDARRSDRQIFRDRQAYDDLADNDPTKNRSLLKLDVSFSTFSRAMKKVDPSRIIKQGYENLRKDHSTIKEEKGLISGYRLHYSAKMFSIFDTCIFKGRVSYDYQLNQLYNLIKKDHPFKFRMNFSIYDTNEFFWYLPLPSQFLNAFTEGLTKYVTPDYEVIWINYGSAILFPFWPENFDLEAKKWKIDHEWMVENPIMRFLELEKTLHHLKK